MILDNIKRYLFVVFSSMLLSCSSDNSYHDYTDVTDWQGYILISKNKEIADFPKIIINKMKDSRIDQEKINQSVRLAVYHTIYMRMAISSDVDIGYFLNAQRLFSSKLVGDKELCEEYVNGVRSDPWVDYLMIHHAEALNEVIGSQSIPKAFLNDRRNADKFISIKEGHGVKYDGNDRADLCASQNQLITYVGRLENSNDQEIFFRYYNVIAANKLYSRLVKLCDVCGLAGC